MGFDRGIIKCGIGLGSIWAKGVFVGWIGDGCVVFWVGFGAKNNFGSVWFVVLITRTKIVIPCFLRGGFGYCSKGIQRGNLAKFQIPKVIIDYFPKMKFPGTSFAKLESTWTKIVNF